MVSTSELVYSSPLVILIRLGLSMGGSRDSDDWGLQRSESNWVSLKSSDMVDILGVILRLSILPL